MTFQNRGEGNPEHHIDPNKLQIVAVRKNGDGDISEVKFQNGETATIEQAIVMAEQDLIEDVNIGTTRGHQHKTLRSYPDGDPSNNLSNLPSF
ncbi:DUF3892 domain-containing protein [Gottfriedia sp. OAE603]|uniref:DUF3892 domain-containing protein n=1 Tax=Gottfriedia sp. OAE603 TaxID=2663872 RepID=UPI0019F2D5A5